MNTTLRVISYFYMYDVMSWMDKLPSHFQFTYTLLFLSHNQEKLSPLQQDPKYIK